MAQSVAVVALISILWVAFEYSLVFAGDGPARHTAARLSRGHDWRSIATAIGSSI